MALKKENNTKKPKQASSMLEGQHIPYGNMFSILLDKIYNQILMTMKKLL